MDNSQENKQERDQKQLLDTYNDDHWQKKYGVSSEELKKAGKDLLSIPAKIIDITKKTPLAFS